LQPKSTAIAQVLLFLAVTAAQAQSPTAHKPATEIAPEPEIPTHTLNFEPLETDPTLPFGSLYTLPIQCAPDGALFVNSVNPKDPGQQTLYSVHGKKTQTYLLSAISDLHDIQQFSFFPTDSQVGILVRASKEPVGQPGPGKSHAGISWGKYHYYIALFDRNGSYKESIELSMFDGPDASVSHIALLPSGEFLVVGYDRLNSVTRLLLLSSGGQIVRTLDLPASRTASPDTTFRSGTGMMAAADLIGSIAFVAWNQDILVSRRNSPDPILDVRPGGGVREVTVQPPPGWLFEEMISAGDRWVARFHTASAAQNAPEKPGEHVFYELHPEDAGLALKLIQPDKFQGQIACRSEGKYLTFRDNDKNEFQLFAAE
jgi:hypothetical protein